MKSITVKHENDEFTPNIFDVEPQKWTFTCSLTIGREALKTGVKGHQFPIISNMCATGHMLQGCNVKLLSVNDWCCGQNWIFVVLSCMKNVSGLCLHNALTTDLAKCVMDPDMTAVLEFFAILFH